MDLKERNTHIALFDVYGNLLTEKQKSYFEAYYFDDLSLAEIADCNNVSRNAVFDQIKKTVAILVEFENELKIYEKTNKLLELAEKLDSDNKLALLEIIKE